MASNTPVGRTEAERIARSALGPTMIDMRAIANCAGVTYRCVQAWRKKGELPPPDFALGGVIRWRPSTIQEFLKSRSAGMVR